MIINVTEKRKGQEEEEKKKASVFWRERSVPPDSRRYDSDSGIREFSAGRDEQFNTSRAQK